MSNTNSYRDDLMYACFSTHDTASTVCVETDVDVSTDVDRSDVAHTRGFLYGEDQHNRDWALCLNYCYE